MFLLRLLLWPALRFFPFAFLNKRVFILTLAPGVRSDATHWTRVPTACMSDSW